MSVSNPVHVSFIVSSIYKSPSFLYSGFSALPGTDILNPGLVADGTRCGNGRVGYCICIQLYIVRIKIQL